VSYIILGSSTGQLLGTDSITDHPQSIENVRNIIDIRSVRSIQSKKYGNRRRRNKERVRFQRRFFHHVGTNDFSRLCHPHSILDLEILYFPACARVTLDLPTHLI
jgi:hypothetical protein